MVADALVKYVTSIRPMTALAPMRTLNRPKPTVDCRAAADGVLILSAGRSLPDDRPLIIDWLQRAAERRPHVTFLAERRGPDRALAAPHLCRGLGEDRRRRLVADRAGLRAGQPPAAILSDNSLENALFLFGALRAGALVAPISPNYSLSGDFARLDHALRSSIRPGLRAGLRAYAAALDRTEARIVTVDGKRGLPSAR